MINVYTDGSCLGNPGNGGWAFLIAEKKDVKYRAGFEKNTTNNQMELIAAIKALEFLNKYNDYTNAFKIYNTKVIKNMLPFVSESFNIFLEIPLKIISRKHSYKIIPINWYGRKIGKAKFNIKELRSKYLFTLIYCFIEKVLLNKK